MTCTITNLSCAEDEIGGLLIWLTDESGIDIGAATKIAATLGVAKMYLQYAEVCYNRESEQWRQSTK